MQPWWAAGCGRCASGGGVGWQRGVGQRAAQNPAMPLNPPKPSRDSDALLKQVATLEKDF